MQFRDPRWGRGQETPGEDPLLSGVFLLMLLLLAEVMVMMMVFEQRCMPVIAAVRHGDASAWRSGR